MKKYKKRMNFSLSVIPELEKKILCMVCSKHQPRNFTKKSKFLNLDVYFLISPLNYHVINRKTPFNKVFISLLPREIMVLRKEDFVPRDYKPKENQGNEQAKIESIDVLDRIKGKIQKKRENLKVTHDLDKTFPME